MSEQEQLDKLQAALCRHGIQVGAVTVATEEAPALPVCGRPGCRAAASLYLKARYAAEPTYTRF